MKQLWAHISTWFLEVPLNKGVFPQAVAGLALLLLVVLLPYSATKMKGWAAKRKHPRASLLLMQLLVAAGLYGIGFGLTYLLSNVWVVFGVELGLLVIRKVALALALLGFSIISLVSYRDWRKVVSVFLLIVSLLYGTLGVNAIYGQYPTLKSLLGYRSFPWLSSSEVHQADRTVAQWQKQAEKGTLPAMPAKGIVRTVVIPASQSGFVARPATIYLPPAALSKHPPKLPVMIVLAGQPGSPDRFFLAGDYQAYLNAFAARHHGLAPIVVSPDQLGASSHNTLCSDTPVYGKAETYISKDVPAWISSTLPVEHPGKSWLIGGFSMGGTCATHLGPRYHDTFGNVISVGGEIHETDGSEQEMISGFYRGDREAYEDHIPARAIEKYGRSWQTFLFGDGQYDQIGQKNAKAIAKAALRKGMRVKAFVADGSGHDWHTVQAVFDYGLHQFCWDQGLTSQEPNLKDFKKLSPLALDEPETGL